jgi:hypothetical protein
MEVVRDESGESTTTDKDAGWHYKRLCIVGFSDESGTRAYKRDKEYGFRPMIGTPQPDSTVYRDHRDPPGAASPKDSKDGAGTAAAAISKPVESATLTLGIKGASAPAGGGPPGSSGGGGGGEDTSTPPGWSDGPDKFVIEYGLISDKEAVKSAPDWNPLHYGGKNRSTLIHGDPVKGADKDIDFPKRYFGRLHDLTIVRQTQDVKLSRVRFKPGGDGAGFFKRVKSTEKYDEGMFKGMLNITPKDNPSTVVADQPFQGVHDLTDLIKGKHGYGPHAYNGVPTSGTAVAPEGQYFQGGWCYDGYLGIAGQMFHDVMGIEAGAGKRYTAKEGFAIGTGYIRDDARFGKDGSLIGRIRFRGVGVAAEPGGIKFWADHFFDLTKKNEETDIYHETGEWRVIWELPEF